MIHQWQLWVSVAWLSIFKGVLMVRKEYFWDCGSWLHLYRFFWLALRKSTCVAKVCRRTRLLEVPRRGEGLFILRSKCPQASLNRRGLSLANRDVSWSHRAGRRGVQASQGRGGRTASRNPGNSWCLCLCVCVCLPVSTAASVWLNTAATKRHQQVQGLQSNLGVLDSL